ncbi:MAG: MFS transporter [Sinobacteraceae bacterium]|nr:MFS transporter [Nevskiaceae bacterium]
MSPTVTTADSRPSQVSTQAVPATAAGMARPVSLLLNLAHAIDHMFLLIFATAVGAIAADFGFSRWEDLMPYGVGAFVLFGLGSLPSGRFGDLWGRRRMMLLFFFGIGSSALLAAATRNAWQLAAALTLLGAFASIYHPVGIPMLLQRATRPGVVIGVNGLAGNLGIAIAALSTGFMVQWLGWRAAFALPGLAVIGCGLLFAALCPQETEAPAKRTSKASASLAPAELARVFAVMTAAAVTSGLLFNFTTNGNAQLLSERFRGIVEDPALLGAMLAAVYALASLTQVVVGRLIDRVSLKPLYLCIVALQIPLLALAALTRGWWLLLALLGVMVVIFGAVPFTDAMVVRYVDDRMRSRVAGARMALSLGISSLAVWLLGPLVKVSSFGALFVGMALLAVCTLAVVSLLPSDSATA